MPTTSTTSRPPHARPSVPLCTHRFLDDGHTCGSPALRGEPFCYYHHPTRRPCANPAELYARRTRAGFHLAAPQTPEQVNLAIGEVIQRLASNRIDVHRAGPLLYSLQRASRM